MSQVELSPHQEEERGIEESNRHVWGENEGEVGLHISASVEPHESTANGFVSSNVIAEDIQLPLSPVIDLCLRILTLMFRNAEELRAQLEEAENAIVERDEALRTLQKQMENKNTEIDILENRMKMMKIEVGKNDSNSNSSELFDMNHYITLFVD